MKDKKISAVVSVYNEELSLRHFYVHGIMRSFLSMTEARIKAWKS